MQFLDLKRQFAAYKNEILGNVHNVFDKTNFILGEEIQQLEEQLARYVGAKFACCVSSGTDSLWIALKAIGVGPGDEVITTPFTFISSATSIVMLGARPVFVDIDPKTYLIDVDKIEAAITNKTRAIMPVSLFGQLPDMDRINEIASKRGIYVLEDAAQSFGATYKGRKSCHTSHMASTSFFPSKPLGCYGDGGALFTDDEHLAKKFFLLRNHAGIGNDQFLELGINGRMDTLQAAILLAKLPHFDQEVKRRQQIAHRYTEELGGCYDTPYALPHGEHVYGVYTIRTREREKLLERLDVPARVYYSRCAHEQPLFQEFGYKKGDFPESERASREVLSLPLYPWLTDEEQSQIIQAMLCKQLV